MTATLKAHIHQQHLILDESLPTGFPEGEVIIHLVPTTRQPTDHPSPEEMAQSASGFARSVLLDPAEEVWDHD